MVRFFQFRAVEYGGTFALFFTFINYVFGFYGDFSTGVFCRVLYAQPYAQLYVQPIFVLISVCFRGCFRSFLALRRQAVRGGCSLPADTPLCVAVQPFSRLFPAVLAYMNRAGALPRSRPFKSLKL